jgi:transcriptional regulator with XRE-family HTH domain
MPASVQRHNLARLRQAMSLTQSDLAGMIMRSPATIKAVEIGKLALSDKLAALISDVTGADKKWLLENNLNAPVPALRRLSASWAPKDRAYVHTCHLLADLFSRLFAVCRRLREGEGRQNLPAYIKDELELLAKTSYEPDAIQRYRASVGFLSSSKCILIYSTPICADWSTSIFWSKTLMKPNDLERRHFQKQKEPGNLGSSLIFLRLPTLLPYSVRLLRQLRHRSAGKDCAQPRSRPDGAVDVIAIGQFDRSMP